MAFSTADGSSQTNVGPVGIAAMALAYGAEGMACAVVLLVVSNLLHFTLGAGVMSGRHERAS